jgi:hypothetical protein
MPRPTKPAGLNTPGLLCRKRKHGFTFYWVARGDLVKRGYSLKSSRQWPPSIDMTRPEPTADEWLAIASNCERLQTEMLQWANLSVAGFDPRAIYDGTMASAIRIHQTDPDSPFQNLRYHSKTNYESMGRTLTATVGSARIPELTFRDFKRWHEGFCKPKVEGGPLRKARGHGLMTHVRIVISFGALLKLPGCRDAKEVLAGMEFTMPKRRKEFITPDYAIAIRQEAHRQGVPSVALAQAFMFDLMLRQKDVIGETVPVSEPGISEVTYHGRKWLHGIHWKEVSPELILTHRLSKSLKGREAINDPTAGKTESFDLKRYSMVMEELEHATTRSGPLVICEATGRPWNQTSFEEKWRKIATAVGVPLNVQNRDSRAGGITEAFDSAAPADQVRRHAGHSQLSTTMGYSRDSIEAKNNVQDFRARTRTKPDGA